MNRNLVLKTQRLRKIDSERVNSAKENIIRKQFKYLRVLAIQAIPVEYQLNMDEAGLMKGMGSNDCIVGSSATKAIIAKQPGLLTQTFFIECTSVTGVYLLPAVIYKGRSI